MIFLRFKAEFRFRECPILLSFITIHFLCKVLSVLGFVFDNAEDVSLLQSLRERSLVGSLQTSNENLPYKIHVCLS